jgi:CO/xanthine dehydrogenase FAD-binding subunit
VKNPEIPAANRVESIDVEDVPGLSMAELETEARRCVSCGCLAVGPSDLAIALVALDASIVTTQRTIAAKAFFTATAECSTVLEPDELIREIQIPKPPKGARQSYRKFTLRKPLDFAIVSVASIITSQNGICSDARITLGAVAPAPWRASAAEDAIKGKPLTEAAAREAADMALDGATPLSMNAYKAEIARVLVKRSIMGIPD